MTTPESEQCALCGQKREPVFRSKADGWICCHREVCAERVAAARRLFEDAPSLMDPRDFDLQAGGRGMTPEEVAVRYPEVMECTGDGASWCPICGNCWCGRRVSDGERVNSASCPLHGEFSDHGTLRRPIEPETDYEALGYPETVVGTDQIGSATSMACIVGNFSGGWAGVLMARMITEKDIRTSTDNG